MFVFIVNTKAGKGRAKRVWTRVEEYLKDNKIEYQVLKTVSKEEIMQLRPILENARGKVRCVIAIGGDGTSHSVINELAGTDVPFSIIPTGSGNDFARANGISKDCIKQINHIVNSDHEKMDVITMGAKSCLTVIGLGFDGLVAKVTNEIKIKKWLGSAAYIYSVLKVLNYFKPANVVLTIDGEEMKVDNVWLIAIANHPYYGGGMKICPNASSKDGLLDICVVHSLSKWKLLSIFPLVFSGKHLGKKGVNEYRGKTIQVSSEKPLMIHGDGEMIGETPVTISVKEQSLNVIS
ncbi:diacylglycerol/lipid kinase family protein [Alkalihalophilus marmarensis]|uniref:diacylglycerol/lipid kinase family protein n=1 Tax=Alkalihalophilus marmarensis TaxID=521377 RepID=UPI002DBD3F1F|nr:diacylglycerol kinase family protein [Alkalihalophilus marmarensis]MEC2074336.1 diacylglycerol kinase family lipid kinase [Alkalihalophilus marmarensis]